MTTEYIRYFVEVCKSGSIQSAAKNLFISSQGLGQGIKRLEKSIGIQLLERNQTGAVPTEFGKLFYEQACVIESEIKKLEEMIEKYEPEQISHIIVGVVEKSKYISAIHACGDEYCAQVSTSKVQISIKLFSQGEELIEALSSGAVDIGLLFHQSEFEGIEYHKFSPYSRLMVLLSKNSQFANQNCVRWEDLKNMKFVAAGENDPFSSLIRYVCKCYGFEPNNTFYTTENNYIAGIVDSGKASILLRENYFSSIFQFCKNSVVLPVEPETEIADSILLRKDNSNREVRAFAKYLSEYLISIIR